jgi:hypothetical protein
MNIGDRVEVREGVEDMFYRAGDTGTICAYESELSIEVDFDKNTSRWGSHQLTLFKNF